MTVLPRAISRLRTLFLALAISSVAAWLFLRWEQQEQTHTRNREFSSSNGQFEAFHGPGGHAEFWRQLQPLLATYEPKCDPPMGLGKAPSIRFEVQDSDHRPELLDIASSDVDSMKTAHRVFVDVIKAKPPKLNYVPGTKGLVSTAGGAYLPVFVISLRMLRRTGSNLPMEVFLSDESEYEHYICDVVLPPLNARCMVLSHVLDAVPGTWKIEKYQFKPFAMLFSSFEEILFLDADAFPLMKPEALFTSEPYRSKKMVTWPDFWSSTVSPIYYEITSQPVPPINVRQSTESGEILISKKTHLMTLLLCTYYNFWGPTHYYRLFSQGASGEGDKETFVAAAMAVEEPFYQVSEPICAIGHRIQDGMAGSAMVQADPIDDYALTVKDIWRVRGMDAPAPKAFFVHANFPKFNPATVFTKQAVNPAFTDDGSYTRAWTIPENKIQEFGVDVEKHFWEEILKTACELEDKFESWKGQTGICDGVKNYWNAIFGGNGPSNA